jgi:hypothetical protein
MLLQTSFATTVLASPNPDLSTRATILTLPANDESRQRTDIVIAITAVVSDPPIVEIKVNLHHSSQPTFFCATIYAGPC